MALISRYAWLPLGLCAIVGTTSAALADPTAIAPSKRPLKIELKNAGVPVVKETQMTREQFQAMQVAAQKQRDLEAAQSRQLAKVLGALVKEYKGKGMHLANGDSKGSFALVAPAIASTKDPKARKAQAAQAIALFRTRTAKFLPKDASLSLFADEAHKQPIK